jgi:AraC-like DNA-binding protein/mannose-6-phosphate isomerase-like protein (cupin superfamily)
MRPQLEPIVPLESNSFKAFILVKKEFNFPFHYHPEFELIYILSSSGVRYTGNQFENFKENDLVFLGPYLPHCLKNHEENQEAASALVIQWKPDLLGEGWLDRKEFIAVRRLHDLSAKGIKFSQNVALDVKQQLIELVEDPSAFGKIMRLLNVLNQLASTQDFKMICRQDFSHKIKLEDNERLNKIYRYLEMHYKEKIRLSDVASLVCMAEESFSRFFSKLMKRSFFAFLNEYRINIACKLLVETDLQIAQVSDQSGYESTSFFFRQFRKYKNCSPQYYRKKFKSTGGYSIPV